MCGTPDAAAPYSPNARLVNPANGATLDPAMSIRVEFDVEVTGVSTGSFTVNATGSSLFVVGDVIYNPVVRQAEFFRVEGLPPNMALTVTLTPDIIDPMTQKALRQTQFDIATGPDITRPTVIMTSPFNGQGNLSVASNATARFSEPVQNVTASTFTLHELATGNQQTAMVTYDFDTRTATLNPQDQLTPNLQYQMRVNSAVTDFHGNSVSPTFTSGFMTGADNIVPTVRTTSPLDAATNVSVNADVIVTFDEPVTNVNTTTFQLDGGTIAGTLASSNGNKTWTFDPTASLPAGTTISVSLGTGIQDTSGNALAAVTFSFTTQ